MVPMWWACTALRGSYDPESDHCGATGAKHCLNVYQCTGKVTLNNVALMNSATAGLVINGSTVVANGLTTSGNVWGAVNVDKSSSFTLTALPAWRKRPRSGRRIAAPSTLPGIRL